jgi:hypothetical protein
MLYCVDTSAWLDGWQRHYPVDVFPSLWTKIDTIIAAGQIISCEEVYVELKRKDDDIHKWIMGRKQMLVPPDEAIQSKVIGILKDFPRLVDTLRNRSKADPFVIATAMDRGAVLVTGEILTGRLDKPRIPDVCQLKGLPWMNFLQMIRDLKLTF